MHRLPFALALSAALTFAVLPARADEPSAADGATALQLYKDGKRLRERGEMDAAIEKLRAAHALVETPITAMELARTYEKVGRLVEAREMATSVPRIPVRKNESEKASETRAEAETFAAAITPRLASITVRPRPPTKPTPKIAVDGVTLPAVAALERRVVDPGKHVVSLEANGRTVSADVELAEGQAKDVEIDVPTGSAATNDDAGRPHDEGGGKRSPLVYVGFGVAAVGLGVGTVTGLMALSKASDVKSVCTSDGRCPSKAQSNLDATATMATVSTIGFAVGAAGVVLGVVGLLAGPSKPDAAPAAAQLWIGPSGGGVRGTF